MSAYFAFEQASPEGELKYFVIRLDDPVKIAHARRVVSGEDTLHVHVHGTVVPTAKPYNPDWSFHLAPASIGFFDMQMEVCDANVTYVEDHLDEVGGAFLPKNFWCPWSSRLVEEVGYEGPATHAGDPGAL